jgi:hypothetical protein
MLDKFGGIFSPLIITVYTSLFVKSKLSFAPLTLVGFSTLAFIL